MMQTTLLVLLIWRAAALPLSKRTDLLIPAAHDEVNLHVAKHERSNDLANEQNFCIEDVVNNPNPHTAIDPKNHQGLNVQVQFSLFFSCWVSAFPFFDVLVHLSDSNEP